MTQSNSTTENQSDILPEGQEEVAVVRKGEYSRQGDFHKNLDPNWSYYPIYINKKEIVDELIHKYADKNASAVLDAGCGEGVLVEKYASEGWNIKGIDKNYASQFVQEGSLMDMPFDDANFDTVLCLDVMEHLLYPDQNAALKEIKRIIKPDGTVIFSIPNLAHFTSRIKFFFKGRLLRTASIGHHPGDRPVREYIQLFKDHGLEVIETQSVFPTVPPIWRFVMKNPAKSAGLLRFLRKIPFPHAWCFQVLMVCKPSD